MKKQGKIKSITLPSIGSTDEPLLNGMQIIYHAIDRYVIGKIIGYHGGGYYITKFSSNVTVTIHVWDMRQLVVEYETEDSHIPDDLATEVYFDSSFYGQVKQLPLKYSQWQAAIKNGEMDTEKVVNFEPYGLCVGCNRSGLSNCAHADICGNNITIAKIIPTKKRMFTEEDIRSAFNAGMDYAEATHEELDLDAYIATLYT